MNQYFNFNHNSLSAREPTISDSRYKDRMIADFNPFMSTFNGYYNNNKKMMSVIDQFYQDFNIINNTVNSYSKAKPSPLERRLSALDSKDYKRKFGAQYRDTNNADCQTTANTNFARDTAGSQMLRSNTYNHLPDSRKMDFSHLKHNEKYVF